MSMMCSFLELLFSKFSNGKLKSLIRSVLLTQPRASLSEPFHLCIRRPSPVAFSHYVPGSDLLQPVLFCFSRSDLIEIFSSWATSRLPDAVRFCFFRSRLSAVLSEPIRFRSCCGKTDQVLTKRLWPGVIFVSKMIPFRFRQTASDPVKWSVLIRF